MTKYINTMLSDAINIYDEWYRYCEDPAVFEEFLEDAIDDGMEISIAYDTVSREVIAIIIHDDLWYRYCNDIFRDDVDYDDFEDAYDNCDVYRLDMLFDLCPDELLTY